MVGRERVIAGTNCGFGSASGSGKLDPEVVYLKLGSLVAGAALSSKELWGCKSMDQASTKMRRFNTLPYSGIVKID